MSILSDYYHKLQLLSLDIVAGALGAGVMVSLYLEVELPWSWWLAMPLSVWVIYTADHLLDAIRVGKHASNERHRFHAVWIRPIGLVWLLAFLVCVAWLPFIIPVRLLWLGIALGILSCIHFGLVWLIKGFTTPWLAKEIGVALVYTAGVWGGPVLLQEPMEPGTFLIPLIQFFLLALFNLMTFSIYEELLDEKDGFSSWVRGLGTDVSYNLLKLFNGLIILGGVVHLMISSSGTSICLQLTFLGMLVMLNLVAWRRQAFAENDLYRTLADAAFLIPLIWLFRFFC